MFVTFPTLLGPESAPTSPENVWGIGSLFLNDWSDGCEITTSWPGNVGAGYTTAEKRAALTNKPIRTIRFTIKTTTRQESWALKNILLRMGQCRALVPIYPDYSLLTAAVTSGATEILCDTTLRRFFAGAMVAICTAQVGTLFQAAFETVTISSLATNAIILPSGPGTSAAYPLGSRVLPLIVADIWPSSEARAGNGGLLSVQMTAVEVAGSSALPALANPGDSFGFNASAGVPVFDLGPRTDLEWLSVTEGWRRENSQSKLGQGSIYNLFGPRPRSTSSRSAKAITRATAWKLLQFFDTSRGQTFPFFAAAQFPFFTPIAVTSTSLQVKATGPLQDWSNYSYLYMMAGGSGPSAVSIIPITGVTRSSGVDTIAFAAITAPSLASIICVSIANLMRFDSTSITEKWKTSRNLSMSFSVLEVLNEGPITVSNIDQTPSSYTLTPDILSATPVYAGGGSGIDLPAGTYVVTYVSGSMSFDNLSDHLSVSAGSMDPPDLSYCIVYNGGSSTVLWPTSPIRSTPAAVAADQVGVSVSFSHTGGTISMYFSDTFYSDNIAGPTGGLPTFLLTSL